MSELVLSFTPGAAPRRPGGLAAWLAGTAGRLRDRAAQRSAFHQLRRLDDRMLKDIGLYRTDLLAVGSRYGSRPVLLHDL